MKKTLRKCKYEEKGVSPVIGIILMVAVTVVLAATLYLMLPKANEQMKNNPLITLTPSKQEGYNWTINVVCGSNLNPIEVKYAVIAKNASIIVPGVQFPLNASQQDPYGITWIDLNGDGKLNTNDQIKIDGSIAGIRSGDYFKITAGAVGQCELPY